MPLIDNGDEYRVEIQKKNRTLDIFENEDGEIVIRIYDKVQDKKLGDNFE